VISTSSLLLLGGLLSGLGDLSSRLVSLLDGLNDTDGNGLSHITDSETAERRILVVRLNTHGLAGDKLDDGGITRLDEFGGIFKRFTSSAIDLLDELSKLASNVGGVAIKDGSVASADLSRVVKNDDLGVERGGLLGGVVLGVGSDIAATNVLDGNVLDIEADVVAGVTLLELLVMHLDRLDFGGDVGGSEVDDHTSLDDTSFDTTDGHCSNTTDLVDILEGKTEGLVGGTDRGLDGIDGIQQGLTLEGTSLAFTSPALEPGHVVGTLQHVVSVPSRDGDEGDSLGIVSDLLDEVGGLLDDFVEAILRPLGGVHLVDGNNELTDTEGEGEQGMFTSLTILRDTSFEFTSSTSNDKDGTIGLGSTSDHVFNEVTMTRGVNDSDHVFGGFELPESDINGDTTLTFGLELVKNPSILEGTLAEFSSLLLELLNGTLVNTTALVDQVTSSCRLARVDVANDDNVNVNLLNRHC